MVLKRVIGLIFAGGLIFSAAAADFVIRIAPPRVVVQKRDRAPARGYVWVQGYQSWDGRGYAWVPGRWEQPPRPRARWTPHKWTHQRNGNWVLIEGRWR
jgi:hypothetical protein